MTDGVKYPLTLIDEAPYAGTGKTAGFEPWSRIMQAAYHIKEYHTEVLALRVFHLPVAASKASDQWDPTTSTVNTGDLLEGLWYMPDKDVQLVGTFWYDYSGNSANDELEFHLDIDSGAGAGISISSESSDATNIREATDDLTNTPLVLETRTLTVAAGTYAGDIMRWTAEWQISTASDDFAFRPRAVMVRRVFV